MKTLNYLLVILLVAFVSCNSGVKTNGQKVTFGIYEIVKPAEIPQSVIDTLELRGVIVKNVQKPALGLVKKSDTTLLRIDLSGQNFKLLKTVYPVEGTQQYYAIVAVRPKPALNIADIKKSRAKGRQVDIEFTDKGAQKLAGLTKQSTGWYIAFVINDNIYSMPWVVSELKGGRAQIGGIKNEAIAKKISESINWSMPK